MAGEAIGDVPQLAVDRRRIADDPDALAVEGGRIENPLGTEAHAHRAIIVRAHARTVHRIASKTAQTCLLAGSVDRLTASGGQPCLLRPRHVSIEPS